LLGFIFAEALAAIKANRLRSFLTMLGILIGVGAVIMMSAIGAGAQESVKQKIASMGSNLFIVLSGATSSSGVRTSTGSAATLTVGDAYAIGEISNVAASAPAVMGNSQLGYGPNNWNSSVYGVTPEYAIARDWRVASGFMLSDVEVKSASRVAVVGQTVAKNLFGNDEAVGKTIRIGQSPFLVIGELEAKGQGLDGRDQDDVVMVPLTTAQRKLFGSKFRNTVRFIMVQSSSEQAMPSVEKEINELLRQRHNIKDGRDSDFDVRNMTAMAEMAASMTRIMTLALGAIAYISLIVGGIGIMNIMLVSVTERTREIGVRMAIGAKERDILLQFLLEAVVISLIGCAMGVVLGVSGAYLVGNILDLDIIVTPISIIIAFAVSSGIGVFFGYYPAKKAAKLEPIEALRYQ
jgi:putative ABC transport system permease protein